jgi:hypothetical protein
MAAPATESSRPRWSGWGFKSKQAPAASKALRFRHGGGTRCKWPSPRERAMTSGKGSHVATLAGYAPAVPTPFNAVDELDVAVFEHVCQRQIQEGAAALVVCGTTGEAPNLSRAEHDTLVRVAVNAACGRVPVIAGAGSNSTSQADRAEQGCRGRRRGCHPVDRTVLQQADAARHWRHRRTAIEIAAQPMIAGGAAAA